MDELIAATIKKHYPEIATGRHVPVLAVVTRIGESCPEQALSDPMRPVYAAHVQLLTTSGQSAACPEFENVPLAMLPAYPKPGQIVELSFAFGLMSKPYISAVLPFGQLLACQQPGETITE